MKAKITELLKQYTKHPYIKLVNTGNSAIFLSFLIAKKLGKEKIAIPDQGGWLTFKTFPEILGLEVIEVKTDYGIIDLGDLKKKIDKKTALIMTNLAGYFAKQPIAQISEICKQKGGLFIVDNTDSIIGNGTPDIYVASFGVWKPVNLGYGGFISVKNKDYFNLDKEFFLMLKFNEKFYNELYKKLIKVDNRLNNFYKISLKIKKDLKDFDIIHRNEKGINVIVKYKNEIEKNKMIKYCKENKLEYTICPRYIRVNERAVSIEVKRM